ncbi:hypothetical protein BX616_011249 [Lobosporangium transversale]|nr:hypothetical protein BX616_011249 [Lobosporangium transversale]
MMQYPLALQHYSSPLSPEPDTPIPIPPSENEPKVTKIINCRILRDHKIVEKDAIWIQSGKIIDPHKFFWYQKRLPDVVLDAEGLIIAPGFIEAQINGAFGVDFSVPMDHDIYEKGLLKVNRGLLKYGTTSYCPTIVSSSSSVYHRVLPHLKLRAGSAETGATILGAHVEGPFINKARIGAHELKVLQASANDGYKNFKEVYGLEGETPEAQRKLSDKDLNCIKIITCAPELEGVMDTIPDLVKAGITVSVGHSMANISQAERAVENGATFITHLFNAMSQFHHRDPGVIGLLGSRLDLPRPYYGLICDGIHVHPNSVKIAYDSHPKGAILITDAMSAMGLPLGNYQLGNMSVTKEDDRVYIEGTETLAGRASDGIYTHHLTHARKHNEERNDHRLKHLGDKSAEDLKLDLDRKSAIEAAATRVVSPISPSDEGCIEVHDDGFLPTPPGSTPLSPLKMTPGSSSDIHQLPPSEFFYSSLSTQTTAHGWETSTTHYTHYHEYDEHDVYEHCEEHEGSEHSLRIITLHLTDEDDDDLDGVSMVDSTGTRETFTHDEKGPELEQLENQKHDPKDQNQDRGHLHYYDYQASEAAGHQLGSKDVQREMSDCGCHPPNGNKDRNENQTQMDVIKACTDLNADGDLCCPSSSVITLDACVRNFIKFTHCSLVEALEAVTLHPATLLGIQDTKGVIKPGADADLVFLSDDLYVKRVFVAGEEVDLKSIDVEAVEKF